MYQPSPPTPTPSGPQTEGPIAPPRARASAAGLGPNSGAPPTVQFHLQPPQPPPKPNRQQFPQQTSPGAPLYIPEMADGSSPIIGTSGQSIPVTPTPSGMVSPAVPAEPGPGTALVPANGQQQQSKQQERKRVVRKVPKVPEKAESVLYCLTLKNPIRRLCIGIVEWKYPFHQKKN